MIISILCCVAFTASCARTVIKTETVTVYRDVKVPVRCDVSVPERPRYNGDPVTGVVDLCEYAEKLEGLLRICTEGK